MKTWLAMTAVCGLALSVYAGAADRPVLIACRGAGASQKLANDVCRGAESKPEGIRVVRQGERPDVRVTVSEPYRAEGAGRDAVAVGFRASGLTGSVHLDSPPDRQDLELASSELVGFVRQHRKQILGIK